jgi:ketosteroid isomerase-like protein
MATQAALDSIRSAMAHTNKLFQTAVVQNRNFAALDEIYTEDAYILPPGAPMVSGRAAIKEFWSNLVTAVNAKSVELTSIEVMPSGGDVVEIGRATLSMGPEGRDRMDAKYVVYWREEGGRWKWHIDIWNQNS